MPIRCIAVDDEPLALKVISEYASRMPALQMLYTFDDAVAAAEVLRKGNIDLLFVDVNMPDVNGIELVRSLAEKPLIIFTTAYKKFAFDGFELDAVDYLLKPFTFERFSKAIDKVIAISNQKKPAEKTEETGCLFVRSEYRMVKIALGDILYIEGLEDYIKIHLSNSRPILTLMTLKAVLEKLPENKFRRIHRSYIVSVDKVRAVQGKKVVLTSGAELPVSDSYVDFLQNWMK